MNSLFDVVQQNRKGLIGQENSSLAFAIWDPQFGLYGPSRLLAAFRFGRTHSLHLLTSTLAAQN